MMDNTGKKTITVEFYSNPTFGSVGCRAAASNLDGTNFTAGGWGTVTTATNGTTYFTVTIAPSSNQSWIYLSCAFMSAGGSISQISYNQ